MSAPAGSTQITASATCLSWIPPQAVEGTFKLPFSMGVAHYDAPPPDSGPGAIFDPAMRVPESRQHVTVRAKTHCRLAVVPRDQLDSQALLGVAAQQTGRLREHVS